MKQLKKLREAIDKSGLKKNFIAKQFNLSPSALTRLLSGERQYKAAKSELMQYFGIFN